MNDYGRLSRNPLAVLVFIGLAEIAGAQLIFGPEGSSVVLSMQHGTQVIFAWALLISALFVLMGAAMPEPRAYWLEAGGKLGCTIVLTVYTFTLTGEVMSWNTTLGFLCSAIGAGCFLRLWWLTRLIIFNFYPRTYICMSRRLKKLRR